MLVYSVYFAQRAIVLQHHGTFLLYGNNDAVLAPDADLVNIRNLKNVCVFAKLTSPSPTAVDPLLTASVAYSTWKRWPSGLKMVIAPSYDGMLTLFYLFLECEL